MPLQAPCTVVPLSDPLTTLLRRCRSRLQTDDAAASSCIAAKYDKGTGEELSTDLIDDLFFSGQSIMMMLWLTALNDDAAWVHGPSTALMAWLVIASHTHYVIDVYMVPFVCYTVFTLYGGGGGGGETLSPSTFF